MTGGDQVIEETLDRPSVGIHRPARQFPTGVPVTISKAQPVVPGHDVIGRHFGDCHVPQMFNQGRDWRIIPMRPLSTDRRDVDNDYKTLANCDRKHFMKNFMTQIKHTTPGDGGGNNKDCYTFIHPNWLPPIIYGGVYSRVGINGVAKKTLKTPLITNVIRGRDLCH